ncbi:MAG: hypothetical protein FJ137_05845 [Deltaproteobacteria bacterium]|nr:hypothetical protein [Deltaproteobacteria bacterium]
MNSARRPLAVLLALALSPPLTAAPTSPAALASSSSSRSSTVGTTSWPPLSGLQPAVYLRKRNHDPDVTADLRALPAERRVDVALALLAAPARALPLADDDAYPAGLDDKDRARLRRLEVRAARTGALLVLGDSDDPRALPALLRAVAGDADRADANRADADRADADHVTALAAERLGQQRHVPGVTAALQRVAVDAARSDAVRAGACAGLGRHRGRFAEAALDALVGIAADKQTPDNVVVAALQATANLGSSWAWQADGDVARGAALRAQARAALSVARDDEPLVVAAARRATLRRLR